MNRVFLAWQNLQCTQLMARDRGLPQKLDRLYEHYFKSKRAKIHNAAEDAHDLALIYQRMIKDTQNQKIKSTINPE